MRFVIFGATACALWAACTPSEGSGDVAVSISGQRFVRTGWPTMDGGERVEFADGWEVRFERVVVGVGGFRLRGADDELMADRPPSFLVDVREADAMLWLIPDVPAKRFPDVGYRFQPPDAATETVGHVSEEIREEMEHESLALWIEGYGRKDGREVTFRLGVPGEVTTSACFNGRDETDGMVVGEGKVNEVEITLHLDHLFWDDHDAEEPRLFFGPFAHAAGNDDVLTLSELRDQRLTDLRDEQGQVLTDEAGKPIVYVPREELPDNDLREYFVDTALTVGHFNGEGHCSYAVDF